MSYLIEPRSYLLLTLSLALNTDVLDELANLDGVRLVGTDTLADVSDRVTRRLRAL